MPPSTKTEELLRHLSCSSTHYTSKYRTGKRELKLVSKLLRSKSWMERTH